MIKKLLYKATIKVNIDDIYDEHPPTFEKVYFYKFENVLVSSYGVVYKKFKNQDQLLYERHRNKINILNKISTYFVKKKIEIKSPVIVISNGWSDSFYHFTLESLLKLYLMRDKINKSIVLFPKSIFKRFHQEWFNLLNIEKIYLVSNNEVIKSEICYSTSFPARDLNHHHEVLPQFRDWVLKKMNAKNLIAHADTYPKKIFINRQKASFRKITNYNVIEPLLMEQGYTIIDLEDYSLVDQINFFYHAKKIIGIHGAGFTHICFSKADVIDIIYENFHQNCFLKMAKILDINYTFLRCKGNENPMYKNSSGHNDLEIDIALFKNVLK
jgi:capsular polysaccharide biosynthesis protein